MRWTISPYVLFPFFLILYINWAPIPSMLCSPFSTWAVIMAAAAAHVPGFSSLNVSSRQGKAGGRAPCLVGSSSPLSLLDTQAGPGYHAGDFFLAGGVQGHPRTFPLTAHARGPARTTWCGRVTQLQRRWRQWTESRPALNAGGVTRGRHTAAMPPSTVPLEWSCQMWRLHLSSINPHWYTP